MDSVRLYIDALLERVFRKAWLKNLSREQLTKRRILQVSRISIYKFNLHI